jgi:hypothetical protein
MYEREIEDALAGHPELIEENLTLLGRQLTVAVRRIDLLFEDGNGRKLIVELKRGTIRDEHVGQVISYVGRILTKEDPTARTMLIATRVPLAFQTVLDHFGIAWKEISEKTIAGYLPPNEPLLASNPEGVTVHPPSKTPSLTNAPQPHRRAVVKQPRSTVPPPNEKKLLLTNILTLMKERGYRGNCHPGNSLCRISPGFSLCPICLGHYARQVQLLGMERQDKSIGQAVAAYSVSGKDRRDYPTDGFAFPPGRRFRGEESVLVRARCQP